MVLARTSRDDEGFPYLTGFNDDFVLYSQSGYAEATLERVSFCGGKSIRFGVNWGEVQAGGQDSFEWSPYNELYAQALAAGIQLLPTVFGCPEWADPVVTARPRPDQDPPYPPDLFRTCSPEYDPAFGDFADATLRHFDTFSKQQGLAQLVPGVEILNEPNSWTFGAVPAARLRDLTTAAAERIAASERSGSFSGPMRTISGGLAPLAGIGPESRSGYPPRPSWQEYLTELVGDGSGGFDVGFHSYESAKPPPGILTVPERNPSDPYGRGRQFATWQAASIVDRFDQALTLTDSDIWLTETGASSAGTWSRDIFSPAYWTEFGQTIQAEVLTLVASELKSRPRCKAMMVHRLYSNDVAEPPPGPGTDSPHFQSGVYDAIDGKPKLAAPALAESWT